MADEPTAGPGADAGIRRPAERYGDRPTAWRRPAAVVAISLLAAAGLAWIGWAGVHQATPPIRWNDVGFSVVDDATTRVTFDVIADPGTEATCRVEALNQAFAVVGVAQVPIPPADTKVTRHSVQVATQERAVAGAVKSCAVR
jgi:hypothetical protein